MSIVQNMVIVGSGGALLATLNVTITVSNATSVTASKSGKTVSLIYDNVNGFWTGVLDSNGTWTVTATNGVRTVTQTVSIDAIGVYAMSIALPIVPSEYTQLEWVEASNGSTNQYLNTQFKPINTNRVVGAYMYPYGAGSSSVQDIVRVGDASGFYWYFRWRYNSGSPQDRYCYGTTASSTTYANFTPTTSRVNYEFRGRTMTHNGTTKTVSSTNEITSNTSYNMYLGFGNVFIMRHYFLKVYDTSDTNLVVNLVPAKRNSDGVVGMYNTIANTFRPPDQGTLTAGPEIS